MKNIKVKQRKCPFGKVELCDSYGNCGDCTWHKVIEKYEKRIAKLKEEKETQDLRYGQLSEYAGNLDFEMQRIKDYVRDRYGKEIDND